jgi:LmbE family N-acetylglucosaminyl deacetylase
MEADKQVNLLAIGAHMGDCEIACGLALAAHVRQGKRVAMLHLTPGEKGHKVLTPEQYATQKREEAKAAAQMLGADLYTLDYRDGELPVNETMQQEIARVIRICRPRLIITHWRGSIHRDHTNCALNVQESLFFAAIKWFELGGEAHWVPGLYFAENWEDKDGFVPEIFLEVTAEDLQRWEEACRCYALFRGEVAAFPYIDYYKALARVRGAEIGTEYAVAFAVPPSAHRRRVTGL